MMPDKEKLWIKCMKAGHLLGCHQMPERSFFYKGYQYPVCARCTGVYLSFPFSVPLIRRRWFSTKAAAASACVMLADWLLQFFNIRESTNRRRLITGLIGGIGAHILYYRFIFFVWNMGKSAIRKKHRS